MKILMISSFLPFPLFSGGQVRLYNIIKELSKKHEITLICEKRANQKDSDVEEIEKICKKVITVPRLKQWTVKNILKTGFSKNPFLITGHKTKELQEKIREELRKEKYDLIHCETSYVFQNLPKTNIPVVVVEHNVEYLVYKRYSKTANLLVKPLLYLDVLKLKNIEEKIWKKATKLVAVSEIERKIMNTKNSEVIPNGVDIKEFVFNKKEFNKKEKKVLFIGDFKWLQNKDALRQILLKIWPVVNEEKDVRLKLWIVGRNIPQSLKDLNVFENVIFDENNNQKTKEIFSKADILLAPIRAGGGTSFKILEAMASGVGVVTTPLGVAGIEAKDREHVLTGDDSSDLAKALIELSTNKSLFEKLTLNARALIEERYDWEKIAQKLDKVYNSIA